MSTGTRKRYDREFKLGAVKLIVEEGQRWADVSRNLGVSIHSLRAWVKDFKSFDGKDVFPGSGKLRAKDEELHRLREELRITRMERDLLKKTLPFFLERPK